MGRGVGGIRLWVYSKVTAHCYNKVTGLVLFCTYCFLHKPVVTGLCLFIFDHQGLVKRKFSSVSWSVAAPCISCLFLFCLFICLFVCVFPPLHRAVSKHKVLFQTPQTSYTSTENSSHTFWKLSCILYTYLQMV